MENLYIDCGRCSVNKHDESLCGDSFNLLRSDDTLTAVLSDGLGSGVKANILSTLTATILSTLLARRLPVEECVDTMASTLPMCKQRKLAYSTFTALQVDGLRARLIQFDNPHAILLRGGKSKKYSTQVYFSGEKEIHESEFFLQEGDMLVLMSDGVTNAGIGKLQPDGWPRQEVAAFLEGWADCSAQRMAAQLVNACTSLCLESPDDDITAVVFHVRQRRAASVLIGPPARSEDDEKICRIFFSKEGAHVICGGSTAQMAARYLNQTVIPLPDTQTAEIPACASLEGVDLVTEGIVTLRALTELAERYALDNSLSLDIHKGQDGVARLARLLFEEVTDINLFFGQAVNHAHDLLDIDFSQKTALIKRLSQALTDMGKNVKISLC